MVAVAGCVAQAEGASRTSPARRWSRYRSRPQSLHRLADLVADAAKGKRPVETEFPADDKFTALAETRRRQTPCPRSSPFRKAATSSVLLCVVPTRGAEYSRPASEIVTRWSSWLSALGARSDAARANVNAYHGEGEDGRWSLALDAASRRDPRSRLRFTTSHPRDMHDDLIALFDEKPMPHLHPPYQAGSDRILAAMNRKHTAEEYAERLIERASVPRGLTSRFRPTSSSAFRARLTRILSDALDVAKRVGFAQAFSFKYSARPGIARGRPGRSCPNWSRRNGSLFCKHSSKTAAAPSIVRPSDAAFPCCSKARTEPGQVAGRSPYLQAVYADGPGNVDRSHRRG